VSCSAPARQAIPTADTLQAEKAKFAMAHSAYFVAFSRMTSAALADIGSSCMKCLTYSRGVVADMHTRHFRECRMSSSISTMAPFSYNPYELVNAKLHRFVQFDSHIKGGNRRQLKLMLVSQRFRRLALARAEVAIENRRADPHGLATEAQRIDDGVTPIDQRGAARGIDERREVVPTHVVLLLRSHGMDAAQHILDLVLLDCITRHFFVCVSLVSSADNLSIVVRSSMIYAKLMLANLT